MKERYQSKVAVFLVLTRNINGYTEILLQRRQNTGYMDGKYDMACSGHVERVKNVIENIKSGIIYDDGDFTHQKYNIEKDTKER